MRIAALIEGESSMVAAMRSRNCSPESEDNEPLCWPDGGWPHLQHVEAHANTFPEAPQSDYFHAQGLDDVHEMLIREADPLFLDSQEDLFYGCNESTHDESSEDSREDDYLDEDNECSLEEMLLSLEMLHSVESLCPLKRRRCKVGSGHGVGEDVGEPTAGVDVHVEDLQSACGRGDPLRSAASLGGNPGFGDGNRGVDLVQSDQAELGWAGVDCVGDKGGGLPHDAAGQGWDGDWWNGDAVLVEGGGDVRPVSPPLSATQNVSPTGQRAHAQFPAAAKRVHRHRGDVRHFEYFSEEDYSSESDDEGGANGDFNGVPHLYRDETWNKESFEYDPPRRAFTRCGGPIFEAQHRMPTFLMLFRLFWPDNLLHKICTETNRYATTVDGDRNVPGGRRWRRLLVAGLKAFFAISMLIGLKRQPNKKTNWKREGGFFHCPIIPHIFSHDRFQQIAKCLHITNPNSYVATRGEPGYDKMGQVRWLVNDIRRVCMQEWNLGKYVTVDEMLIRYKGSYCPAR
jgi:hypothetical protein